MTSAELKEMARLKQELGKSFCRRCEYCQPCPVEIPIPMVMDVYGFAKKSPPEMFFSRHTDELMAKAAECTKCGDCEERCPYRLPIREMIEERVNWYQAEKRKYEQRLST